MKNFKCEKIKAVKVMGKAHILIYRESFRESDQEQTLEKLRNRWKLAVNLSGYQENEHKCDNFI